MKRSRLYQGKQPLGLPRSLRPRWPEYLQPLPAYKPRGSLPAVLGLIVGGAVVAAVAWVLGR